MNELARRHFCTLLDLALLTWRFFRWHKTLTHKHSDTTERAANTTRGTKVYSLVLADTNFPTPSRNG